MVDLVDVDAVHALADGELCAPFMLGLPVRDAAILTLGPPFEAEVVCASSRSAAELGELQLDLGAGPAWDALRQDEPVSVPDLREALPWPTVAEGMLAAGGASVVAFGLRVGTIDVGAVTLLTDRRTAFTPDQARTGSALARDAARHVLRRALLLAEAAQDEDDDRVSRWSRREVYQASGMIAAQAGIPGADALLVLRGHAFAVGRSVRDVAADVITRRTDFTPGGSDDNRGA